MSSIQKQCVQHKEVRERSELHVKDLHWFSRSSELSKINSILCKTDDASLDSKVTYLQGFISSLLLLKQLLNLIILLRKDSKQQKKFGVFNLIVFSLAYYLIIVKATGSSLKQPTTILSNENFTFLHNGSFIQLDAGREWPFNSKREISFKFKTRSPHGLLIYQTFDHNKLSKDDDLESERDTQPQSAINQFTIAQTTVKQSNSQVPSDKVRINNMSSDRQLPKGARAIQAEHLNIKHLSRRNRDNILISNVPLDQLSSNTITATASEKLVNSLFSASPAAAINGNNPASRAILSSQIGDGSILTTAVGATLISTKDSNPKPRNHRVLGMVASNSESTNRASYNAPALNEASDGSTVLSSSAINSFSASLYELYLKLENGRLKIMYEFGSRLNQTYCGKGLNDDRWHRVDLRVDPELNQMVLVLDQIITVEIALSQIQQEEESMRRNELVFTNSVLYMGGLDNNASIVKNVKQRLYMAQFIGCIGQILLKTDQHAETALLPVPIDRIVLVRRGCINRCDTDNYCLHKSTCINYYTDTKCDCFGTNYEDIYCWRDQLTTLSMLGYSTLIYRIYDWRDRHHSNYNRFSLQFKTLAPDSILFFAYGDLSSQNIRNHIGSAPSSPTTFIQSQAPIALPQVNISNLNTVQKPNIHQNLANSNYLAISLSNGTVVVEASFGDQPVLLSNLLYDKVYNRTAHTTSADTGPTSNYYRPLSLADGRWHNITFVHNNRQLFLHVDNYSVNYTLPGKYSHLYFDPRTYIGAVPNLLLNETRTLVKPFNLRHKFVGCLRSVYFNQHNILLALKKNSPMIEYQDSLNEPRLNSCLVQDPSSLPLTMRSGKSYLTFQLTTSSQLAMLSSNIKSDNMKIEGVKTTSSLELKHSNTSTPLRKLTKIEFEYKTSLSTHFLAGGHLRDLSYHDLGGFWTLHAKEDCQLYFTMSLGLTLEPEQVIKLESNNTHCDPKSWFRISISMLAGDKVLNVTRYKINSVAKFEDEYFTTNFADDIKEKKSYILKSSIELLHQVQFGGDLAKFGESSSVPFVGCMRQIEINGHLFDSRDFVTNPASILPLTTSHNQHNTTANLFGPTQSDAISSRLAQGLIILDSCQLVNPCAAITFCKNNGTCKVNDIGEPECDCSKTGYTGKRCHFSIYKRSCQDLFLSGQRKSSHYLIDLDRNGPLKPIRVKCNMDEGTEHIETVLMHNLPAEYPLRRSSSKDIVLDITYLAFHHMHTIDGFYNHDDNNELARLNQDLMLRSLISRSLYCRQHFKYECRSSPLELGNKTWMESPFPRTHKLTSLDGINHGRCMCATTEKKCLDPSRNCNCDSGEPFWTDDSYDLLGHEDVGLTRIVFLKQGLDDLARQQVSTNTEPQSRLTLSDLKCYGTKQHENQHEITFKTSDAYIEVPGWRRGDISFSFRTASYPPAIILYQLATSRNHGYFRLTLISDTRLLFEFIVNRRPRKLHLSSAHKLNNGEWQQVFIEYDTVNLRLTVNDDSAMVDLDVSDYLGTFEGPLFIGGAPSRYLVGDLSKRNGFTGCFRGLVIDERMIDLNSYLNPSMPTVISGCKPSCSKNVCQNGGKCIEYWGSYECECSNPIAHSGINCEINLNTNSITFVTQESYYVQLSNDSPPYPAYLIKNILLNIRTYQETALILYAVDHLNNFIQLHKNGSSLVLTFNLNSTILVAQLPIEDEPTVGDTIQNQSANIAQTTLSPASSIDTNQDNSSTNTASGNQPVAVATNTGYPLIDRAIKASNTSGSGQPIQIKIERHRLRTTFYVNNNFIVIEKPMIFLNNYTQNPWLNPELELVRPPRPKLGSKTYSQIFLANIDEYFNTRLPGFTGCIQGLSIDNQLFDFNRAHLIGELKGEYRIGCKMRCDSFPCKNQGTCIENWKEDRIQCKCATTSYVGRLCDEDIAAIFNGRASQFIYQLSKKFSTGEAVRRLVSNIQNNSLVAVQPSSNESSIILNNKISHSHSNQFNPSDTIHFFELSLAFSTDSSQLIGKQNDSVQVLVLVTRANSSKHFFLGLTPDGSILIQEDYGNSMSLSRLIKRPDHSYNDGYRHMVKYSRYNQTINIVVDYQTYLPAMSVITANKVSKFSKHSMILIGTKGDKSIGTNLLEGSSSETNYTNYIGCISNLLVKIDDISIEPISEAFGQDIETNNENSTRSHVELIDEVQRVGNPSDSSKLAALQLPGSDDGAKVSTYNDSSHRQRTSILVEEVNEGIETIIVRDVEQGKCAAFKKVEINNEKRSINEPKYAPLLEPRPMYMDPPQLKLFNRSEISTNKDLQPFGLDPLFYCSLTFLSFLIAALLVYIYILQVRYRSEKFRFETPFFHKRDEAVNGHEQ